MKTMTIYTIRAQTPEDCLGEFQSDIARRIRFFENRLATTKMATESAKIAYLLAELRSMRDLWTNVNIDKRRSGND